MSDPKDDDGVQLVVKDISAEPAKATASGKPMPEISAAEKALFDKKPAATNDNDKEKNKTQATNTSNTSLMKPAKHIVKKGETLFSIAKVYGIEMQAIRTWNGLKKDELTAGKDLIVGWIQPTGKALANLNKKRVKAGQPPIATPTTEKVEKPKPPVPVKPMSVYHKKYMDFAKDKSGRYRLKKQRGIATWFDDSGEASSGSNLYALHRSAPLRSIVEVKNPINGRSVYVMVIERLPDTPSNKNVLVSLTLSAAKQLNMLDEKTQVEASYYRTK
jgi:rare lipoprotein A (peptidoglycan hydrolase)